MHTHAHPHAHTRTRTHTHQHTNMHFGVKRDKAYWPTILTLPDGFKSDWLQSAFVLQCRASLNGPPRVLRHSPHSCVLAVGAQVEKGELTPDMVVTHQIPMEQAAKGYEVFNKKLDNCVKVILRPFHGQVAAEAPPGPE
jgi:hypothetical protein